MGGGAVYPNSIKDDEDDVKPLGVGVNHLTINDSQHTSGASADNAIIVDDTNIKDEEMDVDVKAVPPKVSKLKGKLERELKALHPNWNPTWNPNWKPPIRPDYTKELDEPSWGDSEDEDDDADADDDEDMDGREGVLDGEDEEYDSDEVEDEED